MQTLDIAERGAKGFGSSGTSYTTSFTDASRGPFGAAFSQFVQRADCSSTTVVQRPPYLVVGSRRITTPYGHTVMFTLRGEGDTLQNLFT